MAHDLSNARGAPSRSASAFARETTWRVRIDAHAGLLVTGGLLAAALLPVLVTPIPAMVDYVNHLARMYVLAADGTTDASSAYRVTWAIYPNLAMDLVVPWLARVMSVEAAARTFLLASQILVVTGAVAIELAVKRRAAISGPIAVLFLYSVPFAWGFLNFEFALGVALWGIASWLVLMHRAWPMRLAVHAGFVVVLFLGHFFAFGLYGFTLGVHELWSFWTRRPSPRDALGKAAILAAPAAAVLAWMQVGGGSIGGDGNAWFLGLKPFWPFAILSGYSLTFSVVGTSSLVALVWVLAKRHAIRLDASGGWLAVGFALLYVAVPSRLLETAFSDIRVLLAAVLILPAFFTVEFPSFRWHIGAAALVTGLSLANIGIAAMVWRSYETTYGTMITSFARLDAGARVLVGHSGEADDPPMRHLEDYPLYHAPTLAAHYAKAFVPTLFASSGKQPLSVAPGLQRLAFSCGGPVPLRVLEAVAARPAGMAVPAYLRAWQRDFDYLYLIGDGRTPNPLPATLELVEAHPRFALYRIRTSSRLARRPPS